MNKGDPLTESKLQQKTQQLLTQVEENYKLKLANEELQRVADDAKKEVTQAKEYVSKQFLASGNFEQCKNVSLLELLRLLKGKEKYEQTLVENNLVLGAENSSSGSSTYIELEARYRTALESNRILTTRVKQVLDELEIEAGAKAKLDQVCRINTDLIAQLDVNKMSAAVLQKNLVDANDQIEKLSLHMKKLLTHLKHETTLKLKSLDKDKQLRRTINKLKTKMALLKHEREKDVEAKENIIKAREVLESQLNLMDRKYIDLRTTLDWSRKTSHKENKRLQDENAKLKLKVLVLMKQLKKFTTQNNLLSDKRTEIT